MMNHRLKFICLVLLGLISNVHAGSMAACDNVIRTGSEIWAYKNCLPPAEEGVPKAQVVVGMALMTGIGALKNEDLAVSWFQRAADQHYPAGMYQLGMAKIAGIGVAQDEAGGIALIKKAAMAGDSEAQSFLTESGVPQELPKAQPKRIKNDCAGVGCGRPLNPFQQ